ncbi:MAG: hypothetical protein ACKOQ6_07805 [Bacteroidota bacterium]
MGIVANLPLVLIPVNAINVPLPIKRYHLQIFTDQSIELKGSFVALKKSGRWGVAQKVE